MNVIDSDTLVNKVLFAIYITRIVELRPGCARFVGYISVFRLTRDKGG